MNKKKKRKFIQHQNSNLLNILNTDLKIIKNEKKKLNNQIFIYYYAD
jgi:hypothetical protein